MPLSRRFVVEAQFSVWRRYGFPIDADDGGNHAVFARRSAPLESVTIPRCFESMLYLPDGYSAALNSTKLELVFLIKLLEKCRLIEVDQNLVFEEPPVKPVGKDIARGAVAIVALGVGAYLWRGSLDTALSASLGGLVGMCITTGFKALKARRTS